MLAILCKSAVQFLSVYMYFIFLGSWSPIFPVIWGPIWENGTPLVYEKCGNRPKLIYASQQ